MSKERDHAPPSKSSRRLDRHGPLDSSLVNVSQPKIQDGGGRKRRGRKSSKQIAHHEADAVSLTSIPVTFCICNDEDTDVLWIECENEGCEIRWFHMSCAGLSDTPEGRWICCKCQSATQILTPSSLGVASSTITPPTRAEVKQRTIDWISEEIIPLQDGIIFKSEVKEKYVAICVEKEFTEVSEAILWKLLKSCFPTIKSKRSGPRNKTECAFSGISWKNSIPDASKDIQVKPELGSLLSSLKS